MNRQIQLAATFIAALMAMPVARAGTRSYVTGDLLSGDVQTCLNNMKLAADKAGFTEQQFKAISDNKKVGDFHADKKDTPLHFTGHCDPTNGVWAIGVSGIDDDQTFKAFTKVVDAYP